MEDLRRLRLEMQRPANLRPSISDDLLNPHGFADVFGGPPRSIFSHQLSTSSVFYDDIFWPPEKATPPPRGRNLPLFDIPSAKEISSTDRCSSRQKNSFLSDIFSWEYSKKMMSSRSRSRSKTNSSSVLSSEELSPLRPPTSDHAYDDVSLLASKLRPINVHTKWNSEKSGTEDHQKQQNMPLFSVEKSNFVSENEHLDKLWGCPFQSNQTKQIKESINLQQMNFRVSENDDVQFNSPSSAVSSDRNVEEMSEIIDEMDEEDDLTSSYVIEIDSCNRGTSCESNDVDEAIAWAKEKFQQHSSQDKSHVQEMVDEPQIPSKGPQDSSLLVVEDETSILDEKIRLWMTGKESDVRLLLSSLHHILWPNSGWIAIPLMKLMESSQVKKAYQKSVLCLHPDKLQQRGATLLHKYIAEKAFAALQDAWTAFGPLDASSR